MNISVWIAETLMRIGQRTPDTKWGDLGEVFNKREFVHGSPEFRRQMMLEMAQLRYQNEQRVPYASYFGKKDISEYFLDQNVLDFGCSNGALARSVCEKFRPATLTGIEIGKNRIETAQLYFQSLGLNANFVVYNGGTIPFSDEEFDTIYSFDVFEHVPDLESSVRECYRILKPGGHLLSVFPSFYHWTEHHLSLVTLTPFVHYFFGRETLSKAFHNLFAERGEDAYWYRPEKDEFEPWERSYTINGMTKGRFRQMSQQIGFQTVYDYPLAVFETGRMRKRYPFLGFVVPLFRFLGRYPFLEEFFNHRVVMIQKKEVR